MHTVRGMFLLTAAVSAVADKLFGVRYGENTEGSIGSARRTAGSRLSARQADSGYTMRPGILC